MNKKNITSETLIYILFGIIFILLLFRCKFGFAYSDEALYVTEPYRFWQGDAMLVDEWSVTQMSLFPLIPLVSLFMNITESTEGIFLAFRYLFVILWSLNSFFIYKRLCKYSKLGAAISSLLLMIISPFGIMALSYNSLPIIAGIQSALFMMEADNKVTSSVSLKIKWVIAGFLLLSEY